MTYSQYIMDYNHFPTRQELEYIYHKCPFSIGDTMAMVFLPIASFDIFVWSLFIIEITKISYNKDDDLFTVRYTVKGEMSSTTHGTYRKQDEHRNKGFLLLGRDALEQYKLGKKRRITIYSTQFLIPFDKQKVVRSCMELTYKLTNEKYETRDEYKEFKLYNKAEMRKLIKSIKELNIQEID